MKTIAKLSIYVGVVLLLVSLVMVSLDFTIIDDRDYPEDTFEVYYKGDHIGNVQEHSIFTFEYSRTGKTLY